MKSIGLTGGMGSGKSLISKIFRTIDIPVFDADRESKQLLDDHPTIKKTLINWYGEHLYPNGSLNRKMLADIIFNNENELARVNHLVHPSVFEKFNHWAHDHREYSFVVHEAAILIETGLYKNFDFLILVEAPVEVRIQRIMNRDQVSRAEVEARLARQWTDEEKRPYAHRVINNDGRVAVLPQVLEIYHSLLKTT